jgi:hypothetical protein
MLASATPVKVVSDLLGHASPAITLATYAPVLPNMAENAASAAGEFGRLRHHLHWNRQKVESPSTPQCAPGSGTPGRFEAAWYGLEVASGRAVCCGVDRRTQVR